MSETLKYPDVPYVDDADNLIEQGQLRQARGRGFAVRVARLFLAQDGDYILLQRRGEDVDFPLTLDCSVDGYVDITDSFSDADDYKIATIRETQEELGLIVSKDELKQMGHYLLDLESSVAPEWTKVYSCNYDESAQGLIVPNQEEVASILWLSINEVNEMVLDDPVRFEPGFPKDFQYFVNNNQHR